MCSIDPFYKKNEGLKDLFGGKTLNVSPLDEER